MIRYVGLDVHKVLSELARHSPDGSVQRERVAACPALRGFVAYGPSCYTAGVDRKG
ncbi:MAG: hypothetical protein J7M08_06125 [Planctomycetes bacterium]|nr:hypothetical protein [Planctomycetota bacterium]